MVTKIQKTAARAAAKATEKAAETLSAASQMLDSKYLAANVRDSAQQIWLAGMGAFSRAQAEGGKVFENLMKEGQNLQRKTQGLAEDKIHEVAGKMSSMADDVQAKAGQQWDKLESIFEQRTAKAMTKLGVPTAQDVDALIKRVDELAAAVARLSRMSGGAAASGKAKPAGRAGTAQPARKASAKTSTAAPPEAPTKTASKSTPKAKAKAIEQ